MTAKKNTNGANRSAPAREDSVSVGVRLPTALAKRVKRLATLQQRSVSNFCAIALEAEVTRQEKTRAK